MKDIFNTSHSFVFSNWFLCFSICVVWCLLPNYFFCWWHKNYDNHNFNNYTNLIPWRWLTLRKFIFDLIIKFYFSNLFKLFILKPMEFINSSTNKILRSMVCNAQWILDRSKRHEYDTDSEYKSWIYQVQDRSHRVGMYHTFSLEIK